MIPLHKAGEKCGGPAQVSPIYILQPRRLDEAFSADRYGCSWVPDAWDPLNPKITIDAHIEIENVNEMDVIIDRIDMDFLANSKIIFNGSPTPGDTILEDATDTVTIPMDIDYKVLGETLLELVLKDSVSYELRGTIFLETEVVSDSFPITIKKGTI
ncbi:MAG: LEA type 2 family protein [candidate division WOR-3 bacterium]|nr:LEA type 2 family protein [candidate division WOR-3 bacterium]